VVIALPESTETRTVAVRCRGVGKTYGTGDTRVAALAGLDLDVFEGEVLMLVGPSGSGKTTLISIITALLAPDAGECHVFGRDLAAMNQLERARFRGASIGFVFQTFNLLPALTALENVSVPLCVAKVPAREAAARAKEALERVRLGARLDALPSQLSGGQQQRVAIARALVHDPRLIVCDEPTSNLDHATGQSILETLVTVARKPGRAIIVVTHDPRIYSYADRVALIDDGKIVDVLAGEEKGRLR
jgi:putative ABC transport system ATP-binding protein